MNQWNALADKYGGDVLAQKYILWPALRPLASLFADHSLLDIGCGNGAYAHFFMQNGAKVTGIDSAEGQIELARKVHPGPRYVLGDFCEFNSADSFDYLLASMVICNLQSKDRVRDFFAVARRCSKKGTQFFVTNVAPSYQRSCRTAMLVHDYPVAAKDGDQIAVSLGKTDGSIIGPFVNYFWSRDFVIDSACASGLEFKAEKILRPVPQQKGENPEYILFEFERV